jgi:hypothetical protein
MLPWTNPEGVRMLPLIDSTGVSYLKRKLSIPICGDLWWLFA